MGFPWMNLANFFCVIPVDPKVRFESERGIVKLFKGRTKVCKMVKIGQKWDTMADLTHVSTKKETLRKLSSIRVS